MIDNNKPYRVLARKYRPQNFAELIGQDALVRTLQNSITSGRIAHAFMLTGVRGVGKTTTARIIARALNYKGPDGNAQPTIGATDDCPLCQAISEDRHPDVIEMDAASRTGVDDIREILDGVRYAPIEARYKIYVIDEVHMLSKNAFNALLKTLEEPPEHVKFIFATTEIHKVPITVLSRCQRFDLPRVGFDLLCDHFANICKLESVEAESEAIAMMARSADGSVRDGLSLLDQAIALSGEKITTDQVKDMLGLADRTQNIDLLEKALSGDIKGALEIIDMVHKKGALPSIIIQDLLEITHLLTRTRAMPDDDNGLLHTIADDQLARIKNLASKLSMPSLGKAWQILLKGLNEVKEAPSPQSAAEMVVIRLAYASNLPDPKDLVKKLKEQTSGHTPLNQSQNAQGAGGQSHMAQLATTHVGGGGQQATATQPAHSPIPNALAQYEQATPTLVKLEDVISLLELNEEFLIASQIFHFAHLLKIEHINHGNQQHGRIEIRLEEDVKPNISQDLSAALKRITKQNWMIVLAKTGGAPTLSETKEANYSQMMAEVAKMPLIDNILRILPKAKLAKVISKE